MLAIPTVSCPLNYGTQPVTTHNDHNHKKLPMIVPWFLDGEAVASCEAGGFTVARQLSLKDGAHVFLGRSRDILAQRHQYRSGGSDTFTCFSFRPQRVPRCLQTSQEPRARQSHLIPDVVLRRRLNGIGDVAVRWLPCSKDIRAVEVEVLSRQVYQ